MKIMGRLKEIADPVEVAKRRLLRRTSGPLTSDGADINHRSLLLIKNSPEFRGECARAITRFHPIYPDELFARGISWTDNEVTRSP